MQPGRALKSSLAGSSNIGCACICVSSVPCHITTRAGWDVSVFVLYLLIMYFGCTVSSINNSGSTVAVGDSKNDDCNNKEVPPQ